MTADEQGALDKMLKDCMFFMGAEKNFVQKIQAYLRAGLVWKSITILFQILWKITCYVLITVSFRWKKVLKDFSFPEIILPMAQNIKGFRSGCAFVPSYRAGLEILDFWAQPGTALAFLLHSKIKRDYRTTEHPG